MERKAIKDLKQGEFFRLSASDNAPVWVRGYYYRPEKVYEAYKFDDTNRDGFFKASRLVFVGFEF